MSEKDATLYRHSRSLQIAAYVARQVRNLRLARAMTQEELATSIGVKRESMSRYESGERAISIALLLDIADILGQPVSAFLPKPAVEPPTDSPLAEIIAALHERSDLIPSVQDLLAALRDQDT